MTRIDEVKRSKLSNHLDHIRSSLSAINDILNKLTIHPLFWLVVGIGVITGRFLEIIMLIVIVFIHEMGHVCAALFFRWRIKKIELLPFGGVAEMDEHGNRPLKEELLVIASGPLQHVWMVIASYLFFLIGFIDEATYQLFLKHNFMILVFNLLPIWPLDGGKLLFLVASYKYPFIRAHRYALKTSIVFVCLFMIAMVMINPFHLNAWIVLMFVGFAHYTEWKQRKFIHIRFLLERYYGRSHEFKTLKPIVVEETDQIVDVFSKFCRGCKHQIIMRHNDRDQITFDENELLHAYFSEKRTTGTIAEIFC
ncbi:M50 family metallopeptidase [Calidifontibacillus oryziterrae]|uniref:M50 family metallopeptidase n=1 Tax=Calidifontibacillus oryziterrae TaxID=1191699 RepID=UPI0002ECEC82|nr:site-2 protease family protein [Calidifontibacillus oryziterrae]